MKFKFATVSLVAATLLAAGCATEQQTHTAVGTGVGAAVGAGLGNLIGGNTTGTLVGAAVGGALGGATGYNWNAIRGKLNKDTAGTGTQITEQPDARSRSTFRARSRSTPTAPRSSLRSAQCSTRLPRRLASTRT